MPAAMEAGCLIQWLLDGSAVLEKPLTLQRPRARRASWVVWCGGEGWEEACREQRWCRRAWYIVSSRVGGRLGCSVLCLAQPTAEEESKQEQTRTDKNKKEKTVSAGDGCRWTPLWPPLARAKMGLGFFLVVGRARR